MSQNDKYNVFLSHSGTDTWVARQISDKMTKCGATTFLDEASILVGSRFEDDILSALGLANELVVLLTPWAIDRPYVWAELGAAWGKQIPIVAILHGMTASELQSRPEVPVFIKQRDFISINKSANHH